MSETYAEKLFKEFSDVNFNASMRELERHRSSERETRLALLQMGKAMITVGSSCMGNAAGMHDPDTSLAMAAAYLECWHDLLRAARQRQRQGQ